MENLTLPRPGGVAQRHQLEWEEATAVEVEPAGTGRLLGWRERPAGDPQVVGFGEVERASELWVIAHCRSAGAAQSRFDTLWEQGRRTPGRRSHNSLWLRRSKEDERERAPF